MTFEQEYQQMVNMARAAYGRMGWDREQGPIMFRFLTTGKFEVFMIPTMDGPIHKEAVARLHADMAGQPDTQSVVLMMEGWMIETDRAGLDRHDHTQSLKDVPGRQEVLIVNIRRGREQRIGHVQIDRERHQLIALPLSDTTTYFGRFVGDVRNESRH